MNSKQYTVNNGEFSINFSFKPQFRKWQFETSAVSFLSPCGGKDNAHVIANILIGSFKRTKKSGANYPIDGLARAKISEIESKQI